MDNYKEIREAFQIVNGEMDEVLEVHTVNGGLSPVLNAIQTLESFILEDLEALMEMDNLKS